jgi:uncharacterized protein (DUF2384 family)
MVSAPVQEQMVRIREGLPFGAFVTIAGELHLSQESLADALHVNLQTMRKRARRSLAGRKPRAGAPVRASGKSFAGRLTPEEAEKSMRLMRVLALAEEVLRDRDDAREWVQAPQRDLGGGRPLDYLDTDIGASQVENVLNAIKYGIYL